VSWINIVVLTVLDPLRSALYTDATQQLAGAAGSLPWQEFILLEGKTHAVKRLYSVDLADDMAMRDLAGELGMNVRRDPGDANQVIYSLTL
jgi:hypothetical protein